jgi:hypothetical protein
MRNFSGAFFLSRLFSPGHPVTKLHHVERRAVLTGVQKRSLAGGTDSQDGNSMPLRTEGAGDVGVEMRPPIGELFCTIVVPGERHPQFCRITPFLP